MIENIEIRRANNGYILAITDTETADQEFVYDSSRKLMRELRKLCERMEATDQTLCVRQTEAHND